VQSDPVLGRKHILQQKKTNTNINTNPDRSNRKRKQNIAMFYLSIDSSVHQS